MQWQVAYQAADLLAAGPVVSVLDHHHLHLIVKANAPFPSKKLL